MNTSSMKWQPSDLFVLISAVDIDKCSSRPSIGASDLFVNDKKEWTGVDIFQNLSLELQPIHLSQFYWKLDANGKLTKGKK